MSFDKDTRNALAKMVNACRRTLTEDVTNQLQETFGLYSDTSLPLDSLTHLTLDEAEAAQALREQLDHFAAAESGRPEERRRLAYDRLILEIAFTILNRLAALRLCEDRELVIECVRKGTSSDGFLLFNSISGGALGSIHETYRIFLECMMDELALDLGVLFDRTNPQSAVFPTDRCLKEILDHLNDPDLAFVWSEDETIGWIYQYFNPPEERRAMREASQAPRNSRELAVRNQFFTPRYVVEFLTDNTLGRIWYEMRKGKTSLVEQCRYLVRRPNEVFLDPGEEALVEDDHEKNLSQEELLKSSVYILHRPKKDPRDIKSLDPACGSAHFLLYDFDLMETIYVEAWNDLESPASEETGRTLREDYATVEELCRAVPELILRHNLHGIDIDMRAVQIAAFALWLRAQRSWKVQGMKAKARPRITKSNIVCAEPMPGEADMLHEFTASLQPKVFGQLVENVFEKMKLAGEAGSLLKIEEEIRDAVTEAKRQWAQGPPTLQTYLSLEMLRAKQQEECGLTRESPKEEFWNLAEKRIINALRDYAEQAENGQGMRRRLFAEDAARGFAFVDLCQKRYDVVLMNPPFGRLVNSSDHKRYLKDSYPTTWTEYFNAFLARADIFLNRNGKFGAVIPDRFLYAKKSCVLRKRMSKNWPIQNLVDCGRDVMDGAAIDAILLNGPSSIGTDSYCPTLNIREVLPENRAYELLQWSKAPSGYINLKSFSKLPGNSFAYAAPKEHLMLWTSGASLHPRYGTVATGGKTFDDFRFLRLWWEIPPEDFSSKWRRVDTGGDYQPWISPLLFVQRWANDGAEVRAFAIERHGTDAQVMQSSKFWFKPALSYPLTSSIGFGPRIFPKDAILSADSIGIIPKKIEYANILLGILGSSWISELLNIFGDHRRTENSVIKSLPVIFPTNREPIEHFTVGLINCVLNHEKTIETSPFFCSSLPLVDNKLEQELIDFYEKLDREVRQLYKLTSEPNKKFDNAQKIRSFLKLSEKDIKGDALFSFCVGVLVGRYDVRMTLDKTLTPKLADPFDCLPICSPGMLVGPNGLPAKSANIVSEEWILARPNANNLPPRRFINSIIFDYQYPLRISWDGILVDDPGWESGQPHRDDIIRRIRETLELIWSDRAQVIEQEACKILNTPDLGDYFRRPSGFFQDHLKRYSKSRRKAPIYWPLSTASGSYTIWLYYPRLTDQTLYAVVNDHLEPKIAEIESALSRAEEKLKEVSGREANLLRDKINNGRTLLAELKDLRQEILRIAALPYKPDLNDGVIINAAPFHKLFRLRSWAEDTEEVWNKLERGEYDWSHLAYVLWPDRVREACRKDCSIAIAHGLEDICQTPAPSSSKVKRGKRGRRSGRAA